MIFARTGEVLDQLAEVAAVQLRPTLARGADEADGEARVIGHRDDRRLAVPRKPLDPDLLRVDGLVGLEVVQRAARAPGPGAEGAPIVGLARLPLVAQADDTPGQPRSVIGLDAVGNDDGVAPPLGEDLLLPGRASAAEAPGGAALDVAFGVAPFACGPPGRGPNPPNPNSIITGTGPSASAGVVRVSWMFTVICGHLALSTRPTSRFVMTGMSPTFSSVVLVTSHFTRERPSGRGRRPRGRSPRRSPAGVWSTTARRT